MATTGWQRLHATRPAELDDFLAWLSGIDVDDARVLSRLAFGRGLLRRVDGTVEMADDTAAWSALIAIVTDH